MTICSKTSGWPARKRRLTETRSAFSVSLKRSAKARGPPAGQVGRLHREGVARRHAHHGFARLHLAAVHEVDGPARVEGGLERVPVDLASAGDAAPHEAGSFGEELGGDGPAAGGVEGGEKRGNAGRPAQEAAEAAFAGSQVRGADREVA